MKKKREDIRLSSKEFVFIVHQKVPKNACLKTRSAFGCNLHALFNKHEWLTE